MNVGRDSLGKLIDPNEENRFQRVIDANGPNAKQPAALRITCACGHVIEDKGQQALVLIRQHRETCAVRKEQKTAYDRRRKRKRSY